jgi:hypothetical protein
MPLRAPTFGGKVVLWIAVVLVLVLAGGDATAQSRHLTVHESSRFWIQGQASIKSFTCVVDRVEGEARMLADRKRLSSSADEQQVTVTLTVPVRAFDCGREGMTEDLQETLRMEEHPEIQFELVHARAGPATDSSASWREIEVLGPLTIAGTKRLLHYNVVGRTYGPNHARTRGCKTIKMTYFGIEPPTKAFGLIKVDNRIDVKFDLLATAPQDTTEQFSTPPATNPPSCNE